VKEKRRIWQSAPLTFWQHSQTPNDPWLGKAFLILGLIESRQQNRDLANMWLQEALRLLSGAAGSYPREIEQIRATLDSLNEAP
jgi:hypothetical protein